MKRGRKPLLRMTTELNVGIVVKSITTYDASCELFFFFESALPVCLVLSRARRDRRHETSRAACIDYYLLLVVSTEMGSHQTERPHLKSGPSLGYVQSHRVSSRGSRAGTGAGAAWDSAISDSWRRCD